MCDAGLRRPMDGVLLSLVDCLNYCAARRIACSTQIMTSCRRANDCWPGLSSVLDIIILCPLASYLVSSVGRSS